MKPKKLSVRLKHYKELIKIEENSSFDVLICIELSKIAYGSWLKSPWCYWSDMIKYYPELAKYIIPPHRGAYPQDIREKIIKSLKARLSKKKDIYRDQVYKK